MYRKCEEQDRKISRSRFRHSLLGFSLLFIEYCQVVAGFYLITRNTNSETSQNSLAAILKSVLLRKANGESWVWSSTAQLLHHINQHSPALTRNFICRIFPYDSHSTNTEFWNILIQHRNQFLKWNWSHQTALTGRRGWIYVIDTNSPGSLWRKSCGDQTCWFWSERSACVANVVATALVLFFVGPS